MSELGFERLFRTWCDARGVQWERLRYIRPDAGGEVEAHRLSPSGPVQGGVLVVHGAGNDALFSLTGLFAALLEQQLEVFTFDVDGHGRRSDTRLRISTAADAVPAAISAWGAAERGLPMHAVGVSLGGSLLLHTLGQSGVGFASASLMVAPLKVELTWSAILNEIGPPMVRTVWRERQRFGLTGLIPSFGPFRRNLYPLRLADPPGPGAFGYVEVINTLLDKLDLPTAARQADLPVLLIYGERDRLVPATQGATLAKALPRGELLVLRGETHLSTPLHPTARERLLHWIESHHPSRRPAR